MSRAVIGPLMRPVAVVANCRCCWRWEASNWRALSARSSTVWASAMRAARSTSVCCLPTAPSRACAARVSSVNWPAPSASLAFAARSDSVCAAVASVSPALAARSCSAAARPPSVCVPAVVMEPPPMMVLNSPGVSSRPVCAMKASPTRRSHVARSSGVARPIWSLTRKLFTSLGFSPKERMSAAPPPYSPVRPAA